MDVVGLIGYGAMGRAFAERFFAAGISPLTYDSSDDARYRAGEDGCEVMSSNAELAGKADLIDVIVRNDDEILDVTLGPEGIHQTVRTGSTVFLHSSVSPSTTRRIAAEFSQKGVSVIDACAAGRPEDVRDGTLVFLVGASDEQFAIAEPHLVRMAKHVLHMGPVGAGNVAKLVKNLVTASERLVLWEAVELAESNGISYVNALNMIRLARSEHGGLIERWEDSFDPLGGSWTPTTGATLYEKDLPLALQLAREAGLTLPVTEALVDKGYALLEAFSDQDLSNSAS